MAALDQPSLGFSASITAEQSLTGHRPRQARAPFQQVTGAFSRSGAQTIFFVARWNGSAWEDIGACCLASLINSQAAHEAIAANDSLYVGGVLLGDGGIYTNSVYQLVGQNYIFLGGFNRSISSLAYHNGELYVSGQFTRVNGTQTITNLAKWNGSSWTSVASPLNAQPSTA